MKKLVVVLLCAVMITGCATSKKEKEEAFYNSLEKAYTAVYISDGVGLAVYADEYKEIDGKKWYKVGISKYDKLNTLTSLAREVYDEDLAESINEKINTRYQTIEDSLYTTALNGCTLPYPLDDKLKDRIKKDIKIKKITSSKIEFNYLEKSYVAVLNNNTYTFKDKIFNCTD